LARVSIKLLRHYDQLGLLPPHSVDRDTGYRYYSVDQLVPLNRLLAYRALGFSLRELRRLAHGAASPDALRQMLMTLRADLSARLAAERARLAELDERIAVIDRVGCAPRHEVSIRSIEPALALAVRRRCRSYDEVGELLRSLRSGLTARSRIGGYGAIWHRCAQQHAEIDCEALVFMDAGHRRISGGDKLIEVPACTAVSVLHEDRDEDARLAYRAALDRAAALGYRVAGPMRERYPGMRSNQTLIEAQFPLELIAPSARRSTYSSQT
jgi:DNA-binding transcriptional MerR regulator